jgi:two-component system NarL family response regulator
MMNARIKVFLADDHPLIRAGLSMAFENDSKICIIGTADNGFDAIEKIEKSNPDIVLMDIDMPGLSGVAAISILRKTYPEMILFVMSTYNDRTYIEDSKTSGASGYILKNISIESLARLIVDVIDKKRIISPYVLYLKQ